LFVILPVAHCVSAAKDLLYALCVNKAIDPTLFADPPERRTLSLSNYWCGTLPKVLLQLPKIENVKINFIPIGGL
jgi:hypothetical protein